MDLCSILEELHSEEDRVGSVVDRTMLYSGLCSAAQEEKVTSLHYEHTSRLAGAAVTSLKVFRLVSCCILGMSLHLGAPLRQGQAASLY